MDGGQVTSRQLDVLVAVKEAGSINAAADRLGVKPPVVFRHIKAAESSAGVRLVQGTKRGSTLTSEGMDLIAEYHALRSRLQSEAVLTVACSPVTEELVMSSIPSVDPSMGLVVSHDLHNLRLLEQGLADLVVLDDPLLLMEDQELPATEIGQMDMVHVDKGPRYVRHRYGAQRIGFRHLELNKVDHTVEDELLSVKDLLASGRSFFVEEILLLRLGIRVRSSTDPHLLRHSVMAVYRSQDARVISLIKTLRERMQK